MRKRKMSYYRLYFLNSHNGISRFVELFHDCDEEALEGALAHVDGHPMELWNRSRLVARLGPDGLPAVELTAAAE